MSALKYFLKIPARQRIGRPPPTPHGAKPDRPYTLDERRALARYGINDVRDLDSAMRRAGFNDREAWLRSLSHHRPRRKWAWRWRVLWSRITSSALSDPHRDEMAAIRRARRRYASDHDIVRQRINLVKEKMR